MAGSETRPPTEGNTARHVQLSQVPGLPYDVRSARGRVGGRTRIMVACPGVASGRVGDCSMHVVGARFAEEKPMSDEAILRALTAINPEEGGATHA